MAEWVVGDTGGAPLRKKNKGARERYRMRLHREKNRMRELQKFFTIMLGVSGAMVVGGVSFWNNAPMESVMVLALIAFAIFNFIGFLGSKLLFAENLVHFWIKSEEETAKAHELPAERIEITIPVSQIIPGMKARQELPNPEEGAEEPLIRDRSYLTDEEITLLKANVTEFKIEGVRYRGPE